MGTSGAGQATPFIIQAISTIFETKAQRDAEQFNEKQAGREAFETEALTDRRIALRQREAARDTGRAQAIAGASGFTTGGSNLDVARDIAASELIDIDTLRHGGALQSRALLSEAGQARKRGRAAQVGGGLKTLSTLLTGAEQSGLFKNKPKAKKKTKNVGAGSGEFGTSSLSLWG